PAPARVHALGRSRSGAADSATLQSGCRQGLEEAPPLPGWPIPARQSRAPPNSSRSRKRQDCENFWVAASGRRNESAPHIERRAASHWTSWASAAATCCENAACKSPDG